MGGVAAAAVHHDTLRETTTGAMTEATTETMIVMMKESTDLTGNFLYQQPFWASNKPGLDE